MILVILCGSGNAQNSSTDLKIYITKTSAENSVGSLGVDPEQPSNHLFVCSVRKIVCSIRRGFANVILALLAVKVRPCREVGWTRGRMGGGHHCFFSYLSQAVLEELFGDFRSLFGSKLHTVCPLLRQLCNHVCLIEGGVCRQTCIGVRTVTNDPAL